MLDADPYLACRDGRKRRAVAKGKVRERERYMGPRGRVKNKWIGRSGSLAAAVPSARTVVQGRSALLVPNNSSLCLSLVTSPRS